MKGIIATMLAAVFVGGCVSEENALIRLEAEEAVGMAIGATIGGPAGFFLGSGLGSVGAAAGEALIGSAAGLLVDDAVADADPERADAEIIELRLD